MIFVVHHTIAVLSAKASEKLLFLIKISTITTTCLWEEVPTMFLTDQSSYFPTPSGHMCAHLMVTGYSGWEGPATTQVHAVF